MKFTHSNAAGTLKYAYEKYLQEITEQNIVSGLIGAVVVEVMEKRSANQQIHDLRQKKE